MGGLSLISLNVERSKHLERIVPLLKEEQPDVFCVQELTERDVPLFRNLFRYESVFVPLSLYMESDGGVQQGISIFSNQKIIETKVSYYAGDPSQLPVTVPTQPETFRGGNRAVLFVTVEKEGARYVIGTTHFTWSAKGAATDMQRDHLESLLTTLQSEKEFVLCGDFNMPRGGELFSSLAERYKDNIPPEYQTSIDIALHRNRLGDPESLSKKMVDGLFTTNGYLAHDVRLVSGVSDHMAIVATVEKS